MDIPAKLVIEKMESELAKLKQSMDGDTGTSYRDHAQSLKTYCELLLESQHTGTYYKAEPVRHATPEQVKRQAAPAQKPQQPEKRSSIYDESDEPESDSLFDF
ncbi:YwdI family protein [Alkalicoccus luteus]|uniref:YwdI family protein n=1 Tax=Alkalicoccus luteus TaxID=1237094 RepID=A0A969PVF3_9BACI|nr:YwdI family protein [Alkalicoccus luteus]NJP38224.1 YwdI family protein [Alkalicoccus luteus]